MNMNIGFVICVGASVLFLVFALIFAVMKGKAAILISGFNFKSKSERNLYDVERMVKDQRNTFLLWAVILAIGAVSSFFISQYLSIFAIIIWGIVFFKDVHLDDEKAFEKYKKYK